MLVGALAAYVAFSWVLLRNGYVQATQGVYAALIVAWLVGCVALFVIPWRWPARLSGDALIFSRAVWFNLGIVTMAVLVPHPIRLLLLALPVFGVFYVALYLSRVQVVLVAMCTWLAFAMCNLWLANVIQVDPEFEALNGLAFAALLAASAFMSSEWVGARTALLERNAGLRSAMERLQEMALRDDLTRVHNRRYILEVLARQKALADRDQQQFTLCYCDLDHFKQLNDKYGHAIGDAALRQFAQLAEGVVRNVDYVARFGGEEFILVLVDADETAAANVANRLRERTKAMWISGTDSDYKLTVSVGIARYRGDERVDDVLNRADLALYQSKQAGRDQVAVASA